MENPRFNKTFIDLGNRYRALRRNRKMVQEEALEFGFSVRHYQQLESGRPHSMSTFFRLCEMFDTTPLDLLKGIALPARRSSMKEITASIKARRQHRYKHVGTR